MMLGLAATTAAKHIRSNTIHGSGILLLNTVRNYLICRPNLHPQSSGKLLSIACKELKTPPQDFSFNVAKHILHTGLTKTPQENLLCSPFSVNALLNMLVPGSKGQTLDQLLELLECNSEEHLEKSSSRLLDVVRPFEVEDGPKVSFSNAVWVDQQSPLMHSYEEMLRKVYQADVMAVDFQNSADEVIKEVNHWAKKKTGGMIKSILGEVAYYNDTLMVVANALHLKLDCPDKDFGSSNKAHSLYHCGSFEGSEVLRMPYSANAEKGQDERNFSMYIFVPTLKNSLNKFIEEMKMDTKTFRNSFREFMKTQTEETSRIYVPRFDLESQIPLSNTMKELGLTRPFRAGQSELMRFVDSPLSDLLYVTDVTQKCRIETNERGTTLGVVTYATLCGPTQYPRALSSKLRFVAENPFFFMIMEDISGSIVSSGTMLSAHLTS